MVFNEKLTKNWRLRGLKLRGLRQNQISTANFRYENDQCIKINTLGDFEIETPTHISTTHAISKSDRNFQNRFPMELDEKFLYSQNQFASLNRFQVFGIEKSPT